MKIKAVYFDFDNTLGIREEYAYLTYRKALEPLHIKDPFEEEAMLQSCMIFDQSGETNKNYVMQRMEQEYGLAWPYEDFNAWWEEHLCEQTVLFEDTLDTLRILKEKGYLIGVITNGVSSAQHRKLAYAGIEPYLDAVCVSGDYGIHKPDVRLFQEALKLLDVRAEEAVMVGDIFAKDILGAHRAGMKPIWFNHSLYRRTGIQVDTITRISQVMEILERMEKS